MIAYYISGHGFGHAARQQAVIRELSLAGVPVYVRSGAPRKFFAFAHVAYHQQQYDVGMVQANSIQMDYEATITQMQALIADEQHTIAHEVAYLRQHNIRLIVSDMPAIASDIGQALGLPVYFITHFTWDWVYQAYAEAYPAFAPIIAHITAQYARATGVLQLPFAHKMPQFRQIIPMPLVANTPTQPRHTVRTQLGVQEGEHVALLSMGGLGWSDGDVRALADLRGWRFWMMPGAYEQVAHLPQCTLIPTDYPHYHNLIASADVLIGKAGWSTVAEVIAHQTPMIYTLRPDWRENDLLDDALQRYAHVRRITPEAFQQGAWVSELDAFRHAGAFHQPIASDGAQVIARQLIAYASLV